MTRSTATALREEYAQALRFGIADLNASTEESDPRTYFAAIERHEKLTRAIRDGLEAIRLLSEP
jgi:hypothetical protein